MNDIENKIHKLTVLQEEYSNCTKCALSESRTKVVFGIGNPNARVVVVAEGPGEAEDVSGFPLVGPAGQTLDFLLAKASKDEHLLKLAKSFPIKKLDQYRWNWKDFQEAKQILMQDIFYTNAVLCKSPDNRTPYPKEVKACKDRLLETIYLIDPVIILAVGKASIETLLGKKIASIQKLCGRLLDIRIAGKMTDIVYPVMPILHPSFLLGTPDIGKKEGLWETTIKSLGYVRDIVKERN